MHPQNRIAVHFTVHGKENHARAAAFQCLFQRVFLQLVAVGQHQMNEAFRVLQGLGNALNDAAGVIIRVFGNQHGNRAGFTIVFRHAAQLEGAGLQVLVQRIGKGAAPLHPINIAVQCQLGQRLYRRDPADVVAFGQLFFAGNAVSGLKKAGLNLLHQLVLNLLIHGGRRS